MSARTCWKCDGEIAGDTDDGLVYPTNPPRYAHAKCQIDKAPVKEPAPPLPPILLSVRVDKDQSPDDYSETMVVTLPGVAVPSRHVLGPVLSAAYSWVAEQPEVRDMRIEVRP